MSDLTKQRFGTARLPREVIIDLLLVVSAHFEKNRMMPTVLFIIEAAINELRRTSTFDDFLAYTIKLLNEGWTDNDISAYKALKEILAKAEADQVFNQTMTGEINGDEQQPH